jgi:hypothetical protein
VATSRPGFLLADGSGFTTTTRSRSGPQLLSPLLHSTDISGAGLGRNPRAATVWGVGGRGGSYVGGGRWVGRHDRDPDAWRPSVTVDMAARPRPFHGGARG